jgi:hypothetical protein
MLISVKTDFLFFRGIVVTKSGAWTSLIWCWLMLTLLGVGPVPAQGAPPPPAPRILTTRVSGANLLVSVNVPRGWQAVYLESRAQADAGAWVPRAVSRTTGRVVFRIPASLKGQLLRVRGDLHAPLAASFYRGKHAFGSRKSTLLRPDQGNGAVFSVGADGSLPGTTLPAATTATATDTRTVEESDIWKIAGDTLYFFNQLRGLQVIDIHNPDAPVLKGTLELPAVGEQMYLLDATHVVLLARESCARGWDSRLLVVDVSGAAPQVTSTLPINGWIEESRLVGADLYVASQGYAPTTASAWGTVVSSFDLSNPAAPAVRSTLFYPGDANAVLATDQWLFVNTVDYANDSQNVVRVIDCSAADGTLRDIAGIPTAGQVPDKFSLHLNGDVFAVISEAYQWTNDFAETWTTTLQTFSLAHPTAPALLGSLELDSGSQLFAARFDGARAYLATYFQVDPLSVVDFSDPAHPVVAGHVEVPGYSTYLQPLGNRLLTLGATDGRVAVSLFDVANPAEPALLGQVALGENYSWTEASYDEKALTVLADLGLILVPYEGVTTNGWSSRVQLIDLGAASLTARGAIEHQFAPRRAAAHLGRILSVSNEQLLTANVNDRDHPLITAEADLAWSVNQLFVQDGYLLELATGTRWFGQTQPAVRVAAAGAPNTIVNSLALDALPIAGSALHNGRLYLLQDPNSYSFPWVLAPIGGAGDGSAATNLVLTVVDVSALPALHILGQMTIAPDGAAAGGGSFQAVWPAPNLLVWFSTGFNYWVNPLMNVAPGSLSPATTGIGVSLAGFGGTMVVTNRPTVGAGGPPVAAPALRPTTLLGQPSGLLGLPYWWPWWGNGGARLLACDVSDPAQPRLASSFTLNPTNSWGFSAPSVAQGMVYFSHEQSSFSTSGTGQWKVSDYLDVVDYTDPTVPTTRPPVNIPGQLAGVSGDGAMLYLLGNALSSSGNPFENRTALNACSYDGIAAYLLASLALPQTWPQPVIVQNGTIYLGRASTNAAASSLEIWRLSNQVKFVRQGSASLSQPALALAVFGSLVAAEDLNNNVSLFDATNPANPRPCGQGGPPGCLWFDLNRAAGALDTGLWLPLDDYGAGLVRVTP